MKGSGIFQVLLLLLEQQPLRSRAAERRAFPYGEVLSWGSWGHCLICPWIDRMVGAPFQNGNGFFGMPNIFHDFPSMAGMPAESGRGKKRRRREVPDVLPVGTSVRVSLTPQPPRMHGGRELA